jgi:alkylhydroperoxidase family enzyme
MRLKQPRVKPRSAAECDDETRAILQATIAGRDGAPLNIFATLAHHPKLLKRWLVFGNHVLAKSTIGARERELLILRTGWLCRAEYEWGQHVLVARQAGLRDDEIRRIGEGPDAAWDPFDAALLRAADELHSDQMISDATWRELAKRYDTQQLIDVVFTVGQYTLVSMALNTLGVQRDAGVPGFEE